MRKCHALTLSGTRCKSSIKSGCTVEHDGHSHQLCGQHFEIHNKKGVEFDTTTCETITDQPELPMDIPTSSNIKLITYIMKLRLVFTMFGMRPDNDFILAGTGSRELANATAEVKAQAIERLRETLTVYKQLFGDKLVIMSGMAQGFDALLAFTALDMGIRLWCAVPNKGYGDYYWGPRGTITGTDARERFNRIISQAEKVFYIKEDVHGITENGVYLDVDFKRASWNKYNENYHHANFVRNDFMVDNADSFLVWDPSSKGTADCLTKIKRARINHLILSKGIL